VKTNQFDCFIVGQGLAGTALAVQFLLKGRRVLVFDLPSDNVSSKVAAGLFNPVSGKRMIKTWLADELFPCSLKFYQQVEKITDSKFMYYRSIYRPFLTVAEQNEWMGGSADKSIAPYIKNIFTSSQFPSFLFDELGGILLDQSGFIDTKAYIASVRNWLKSEGFYREERFDCDDLIAEADSVSFKGYSARHIVFCDGIRAKLNKFFSWLPLRALKGETLVIRAKFLSEVVVNRGVYIVPEGTERWRIGSTYENVFDDEGTTAKGREELLKNLESLLKVDFEVIGQEAGVRPATPDRRPILGKHPLHPTVLTFNGMGTKGVILAPYFSEMLMDFMDNSIRINKEVDINRYKSLYWNSH
jgi:glycine/D-amino acid oxidase-like deaminating enzyme